MIPELCLDLKHHFGGGLPQITVASFLLGCFFFLFQFSYFTFETIMRAIALFTELNWVRLTVGERGVNWGVGVGQFYSGYFQFVVCDEL